MFMNIPKDTEIMINTRDNIVFQVPCHLYNNSVDIFDRNIFNNNSRNN